MDATGRLALVGSEWAGFATLVSGRGGATRELAEEAGERLVRKGVRRAEQVWTDFVPREFQENIAKAFVGEPKIVRLTKDLKVYRYWGGEAREKGFWYTPKRYRFPGRARRYLALPPTNTAENVSEFVIPKGTIILRGRVAPMFGQPGGGIQIYVPDPSLLVSP